MAELVRLTGVTKIYQEGAVGQRQVHAPQPGCRPRPAYSGRRGPVYAGLGPIEVILVPLAAIFLAVLAALLPGRWAARTNVAQVLHSE
jgi:hypothetical protein